MDLHGDVADRVLTEFDILDRMLEHTDWNDESSVAMVLAQAKRCRRACQNFIRAAAQRKEELQP